MKHGMKSAIRSLDATASLTVCALSIHAPGSVGLGGCTQLGGAGRDAALQEDSELEKRERHLGVALHGAAVQENLAAQQQEQFPPVLGAPTRIASKKERSGAATGVLSGSWVVLVVDRGALGGAHLKCAKLWLSFTSRTFCKVLGPFNLTSN